MTYLLFMKKTNLFWAIFFSLAIYRISTGSDYLWPLKLQPELTSKFCDYRAGHFHSGLDIRTRGRIGFPVFAIADGHIFRVSTSFRGYGKALYLRLRDDRIVVYGHLSRFASSVDEKVRAAQVKESKYTQDLFFKSDELPVRKGEIVAYSGSTGTGAPHLHFEMRSAQNNPINPLEWGFSITDRTPPEIDYLAVRYYEHEIGPAEPCAMELMPITRGNGGGLAVMDTLIGSEHQAFSISGGDRVGGMGFLYGFYSLRLFVDGKLEFEMNSDSLSYTTTRQLDYIRDLEFIRALSSLKKTDSDANIFYRLHVPPAARQFFWKGQVDYAGVIDRSGKPGTVRSVKVVAADEAGNKSEMSFFIRDPELPAPQIVSYSRNRDTLIVEFMTESKIAGAKVEYRNSVRDLFKRIKGSFQSSKFSEGSVVLYKNTVRIPIKEEEREFRFSCSDSSEQISPWIYFIETKTSKKFQIHGSPGNLKVEFAPDSPLEKSSLEIQNHSQTATFDMIPAGPRFFTANVENKYFAGQSRFVVQTSEGIIFDTSIVLYPVYRDSTSEIYSPDSTLSIFFQPGSAFYSAYVFPSAGIRESTSSGKGFVYDLQPDFFVSDLPVRYKFNLARLGLLGKKVGAYGYTYGSGDWTFIGKPEGVKFETGGFGLGKLALLEDNDPPIIGSVSPLGNIKSAAPTLSCVLSDDISGLALDSGIAMSVDGVWVPAEYDIDTGRFAYKIRNPLKSGRHTFEIKASDNQGNSTSRAAAFTVIKK